MATLILGAVGAAAGGSIAGAGLLGIGGAVAGRAAGAIIGSMIDQRLLGTGSAPVEIGRRDQLRLMGAREGTPIPRIWGQMRLAGHLIWSGDFIERSRTTTTGGKGGGGGGQQTTTYRYAVSVAVAVCQGPATRIGRIWADGQVLDKDNLNLRFYPGDESQLADPLIAASVEGGEAPAYRGTAYVVIEELRLTPFGNRIPQFSFEVFRSSDDYAAVTAIDLGTGAGEYGMATEPVSVGTGKGRAKIVNQTAGNGQVDALESLDLLQADLPSVSEVAVSPVWFVDDLRCDQAQVRPMVEGPQDGEEQIWRVSGITRGSVPVLPQIDGLPMWPATPADKSLKQVLGEAGDRGLATTLVPRLRSVLADGNGLPDPWTGDPDQPALSDPSRVTIDPAPGRIGSLDGTAAARTAIEAFFGLAQPSDFTPGGPSVTYSGPAEWSYRRFILHYAHVAADVGGVEAIVIGWNLDGLVHVRDDTGARPAVEALMQLAMDVRSIVGASCKVGYVAGWRSYGGQGNADDLTYPLDPLWAHADIDFVGIDYSVPLGDWRPGTDHLDAGWGEPVNRDYLASQIEGGEGFDWEYASAVARDEQRRTAIDDPVLNDPWVFRPKDLRNWWARPHWERLAGQPAPAPTAWVPEAKSIRLFNIGCPAVEFGANQPDAVLDPAAADHALPYYSGGGQDVWLQRQYLAAVLAHWTDEANNPASHEYQGRMIEPGGLVARGWDMRPWPPVERIADRWRDTQGYASGHWLIGRTHFCGLGDVVSDIASYAGASNWSVEEVRGVVRGYLIGDTETARQSLQPLALAFDLDSIEAGGEIRFQTRKTVAEHQVVPERLVSDKEAEGYELVHASDGEIPDRVQVEYLDASRTYDPAVGEVLGGGAGGLHVQKTDLPLVLLPVEAERIAQRWIEALEAARDEVRLNLPGSDLGPEPGDVLAMPVDGDTVPFRITRIEEMGTRRIEAVRIPRPRQRRAGQAPEFQRVAAAEIAARPHVEILDLPILSGTETAHAPRIAATMTPWPGSVAVFESADGSSFELSAEIGANAVMGETETDLPASPAGLFSRHALNVRLSHGALEGRSQLDVLNGANVAALRDPAGGEWEVIQFRDAELIGSDLYRLTGILRGQAGTEHVIPATWPAGTDFVLIDAAVAQLPVPLSGLGLERTYRAGPVEKAYTSSSYVEMMSTPAGVGLRPLSPVHAQIWQEPGGDIRATWVRRTRVGGDSWHLQDVPLGETSETYAIRIEAGGIVLREDQTATPDYTYTAAMQTEDGATGALDLWVAQVSDSYGPGIYTRMSINA